MSFLEKASRAHDDTDMKSNYKASYVEVANDEASSRDLFQLLQFIPEDLKVSDLAFRVITLPTNIHKRKRRVEKIIQEGTDRTSHFDRTNFWLISGVAFGWKTVASYRDAARRKGIKPMDIILASEGTYFQKLVGGNGLYNSLGRFNGNAVLVYDAKTQNGVKPLSSIEYTFQNPQEKRIALLGIIAVK